MQLPKEDEEYLNNKGFVWELVPTGNDGCLVIKNYPTSPEIYDRDKVDLMIRIPSQYNTSQLDMFYVNPTLKLLSTKDFPDRANTMETHINRSWQRFSRHLNTAWRPGIDGLPMFLAIIQRELQGKN